MRISTLSDGFTLSLREQALPRPVPRKPRPKVAEVPLPPIVSDELDLDTVRSSRLDPVPEPVRPDAPVVAPSAAVGAVAAAAPAPRKRSPPAPVATAQVAEDAPQPLGFAERKAEMRAAVRRARQRTLNKAAPDLGEQPEVLLVEPDGATRAHLAEVLSQFGFAAHAVASVRDADALLGSIHFVATFIGLGAQDAQAVGLCSRLRALPRVAHRPLAVVAMVEKDRHTDRVRMELAGADAVIFRPVDRGHVARVLEDQGVRLPHDPRAAAAAARTPG